MLPMDFEAPMSSWSHAPSPLPDQRVARLLSTTLPGTLVSLVLAVTPEAPGVTSRSWAEAGTTRAHQPRATQTVFNIRMQSSFSPPGRSSSRLDDQSDRIHYEIFTKLRPYT